MSFTLSPCLTIAVENHHLWCPAPFRHAGNTYLATAAWPVETGFDGWRSASKLSVFEILGDEARALKVGEMTELQISSRRYHSLINPRIVADDGTLHLFCSGVIDSQRYEIAYAKMASQSGTRQLDPIEFRGPGLLPGGQGPTNPAPLMHRKGAWYMLFRDSTGVGGKRSLFAASATDPYDPWQLIGDGPVVAGDIEDPFVWQEGNTVKALIRDIGGAITGKSWASIGLMESRDWVTWHPSSQPHVCNRSVAESDGASAVMHRLERPALFHSLRGENLIAFGCLASPEAASIIRIFALREGTTA